MAVCILKQILIVDPSKISTEPDSQTLYPDLKEKTEPSGVFLYKVKMCQEDSTNDSSIINECVQLSNHIASTHLSKLSTSLPNNPTFGFSPNSSNLSPSAKAMLSTFSHQLKQAAYQFHLMFQTKSYYNNGLYVELANYVNQNLQNPTQSTYFCLPQVYAMSKYLCAQLFKEKNYLF